jgi:hypothetical protein
MTDPRFCVSDLELRSIVSLKRYVLSGSISPRCRREGSPSVSIAYVDRHVCNEQSLLNDENDPQTYTKST